MAKAKQVFTDTQFKSDGIAFLVGGFIVLLAVGGLIASGNFPPGAFDSRQGQVDQVDQVFQTLWRGLGYFFQICAVLLLVEALVIFARHRVFGQSGTFSGACPYCGTLNEVWVNFPAKASGKDCPKCKNRFVLKNRKFYQLDSPSRLDARFSGIKKGIGLVRVGIITACLAPIAFMAGLILGVLTLNILWIAAPILLLIISVATQIRGVWLCLQTPDRISAKPWITATVWLQGITLTLLIGKLFLRDASWLDPLLEVSGLMGQFAFLTFLIRLCNFLQRADLAGEFDTLLVRSLVIFGGLLLEPMFPVSHRTLLLVFLVLTGFGYLLGYLSSLWRLESHIGKALTAYN